MSRGPGADGSRAEHLVFDLDGLLLDSESDLAWLDRALSTALRELSLPVTEENKRRLYPANVAGIRRVAEAFGIDAEELWRERNQAYTRVKIDAIESGELAPFDDLEALRSLDGTHELHIVSNSPQAVVESFARTADLAGLFSGLVGRRPTLAAIDLIKPHPHLYGRLVARVGPGTYTYVGHTVTDRQFAAKTGMAYVPVLRDGTDHPGVLHGLGDLVDWIG